MARTCKHILFVLAISLSVLSNPLIAQDSNDKKEKPGRPNRTSRDAENPQPKKEKLFSGPQAGEKLSNFEMKGVTGSIKGKIVNPIAIADGKPVCLFFVSKITRPGFQLVRTISRFNETQAKSGLTTTVVFLADDPMKIETQVKGVQRYLPKGVSMGVATTGKDGPGAYGLNRNVKLTVLIGSKSKVAANFAINQPQLQVDGQPIVNAIAKSVGLKEPPKISQLTRNDQLMMAANRQRGKQPARTQDEKLTGMLRQLINKSADEDQVKAAKAKIEAYIEKNEAAKKELTRITKTVVNSGKLSNYGTSAAQEVLKQWNKKLSPNKNRADSPKK